jgi:L-2-hydroxycarboxylate dehydrogenase (NAD+)
MPKHMRNCPPEKGMRLPAEEMQRLVAALFEKAGMSPEDAGFMGEILTQNDLRCVFSHGTRQTAGYIRKIQGGAVNPRPEILTVSESPGALVLDGDGGLGYGPCYRGTEQAISKARNCGIAAVTTRNHFHFGAAGNYSRLALEHDCIGVAMSSHRSFANPESVIYGASGGSPISVAIPAGEQPSLVLDMGGRIVPYSEEFFAQFPASIFKGMGLGAVIRALGGVFAGIYKPEFQAPQSQWESNQGAFIIIVDVGHFMPVAELKEEMDRFIGEARAMKPLPGMEQAELAGGMEWQWEKENRETGIPVADEHRQLLEEIAAELGVETPFSRYEGASFG